MTVVPAPVAVMVMPTPVMAVAVVPPVDPFGLEPLDLCLRRDGRMNIVMPGRLPFIPGQRLRRQRRGPGACRQRGGARGKSNGNLQKAAALHDVSLFVAIASDAGRVWMRRDECSLNLAFSFVVIPANAAKNPVVIPGHRAAMNPESLRYRREIPGSRLRAPRNDEA
jgi:hypothetical protein